MRVSDRLSGPLLSVLRIGASLIFLEGVAATALSIPQTSNAPPAAFSLASFSGMVELTIGALAALGLFTRPVALLLSLQMAVGYWAVHAPQSPFPLAKHGVAALLYCFVFLYLAAAGGGAWSSTRRCVTKSKGR